MTSASEAITKYIAAVVSARDRCSRSEDRLAFTKRLASAAEMSAAAQIGNLQKLVALLESEEHNVGWSYLSGEAGASADRAFHEMAQSIRALAGG